MSIESAKQAQERTELRTMSVDWLATIIGDRLAAAKRHKLNTFAFTHCTSPGFAFFVRTDDGWMVERIYDGDEYWPGATPSPATVWWRVLMMILEGRVRGVYGREDGAHE